MQANTDRIQTTHVGSLVRPPELVAFMRKRLEREAVDDGEYSKSSWYRYVTERLGGLEYRAVPSEKPKPTPSSGHDFERFRDFYAEYQKGQQANSGAGYWAVTGPISYRGHTQVQRDIANLKAALRGVSGVTGFLPVVAP